MVHVPQFYDKMSAAHLLNHHANPHPDVGNVGNMNKESDSHNFSAHLQKNIIYIEWRFTRWNPADRSCNFFDY